MNWWLLVLFLGSCTCQQLLDLDTTRRIAISQPTSFSIPAKTETLIISLCSPSNARFFVSGVKEIQLQDGQGAVYGIAGDGKTLNVDNVQETTTFEVGLSSSASASSLEQLPLFGDSTSTEAIVFSPSFADVDAGNTPTFPNYTLPSANKSQPVHPKTIPNMTLILFPTSSPPPPLRSSCYLSSFLSPPPSFVINSTTLWSRDDQDRWRIQFLVQNLSPSTNYTTYVIQQDPSKLTAGPIYFRTKSSSFSCPLLHSLSFCPGVAYSVPTPDLTSSSSSSSVLLSFLTNFTTVLSTFACGRDLYSPIVTCADCEREYRKWLCAIAFPRCAEPQPQQLPLPAIVPYSPRNSFLSLPPINNPSPQIFLPCLEQCHQTDRACPPFLRFRCPSPNFDAGASYAVGYIDAKDGDQLRGLTGVDRDRWGNVWCQLV